MTNEADMASSPAAGSKRVKVISTALIFGAIILQVWQLFSPLPVYIQPIAKITGVVLIIHAIEGLISAALILRDRLSAEPAASSNALLIQKLPQNTPLAVLKAGLYAFFVGTVGLLEVIEATKPIDQPIDKPIDKPS
ncbi:MAG: hypothetical protein AB8B99_16130 [Phormidesmis sp.]